MGHFPAGTSAKLASHFAQFILKGNVQRMRVYDTIFISFVCIQFRYRVFWSVRLWSCFEPSPLQLYGASHVRFEVDKRAHYVNIW